jgi:hypothetical protein
MKLLINKLGVSVEHLKCLDKVFRLNDPEYKRINRILNSPPFKEVMREISREIYAGGKTAPQSRVKLNRQMILGDIVEYILTGRAYYYAAKSEANFKNFLKLILYTVNQLIIFDTITVDPGIRRQYIELLEERINESILYEKSGDEAIAKYLKKSKVKIREAAWTKEIDQFVDSILPKTLGCPKELIVFAELIRLKVGIIIPLLLIQRIFGDKNPIAPPDFLILKGNKEIYGIEVGYEKEGQSREFSIRTSIPAFAVDLKNNMHNRCPKCGRNILYCDPIIEAYSNGTLEKEVKKRKGKFYCEECPQFNNGQCKFSNYYGWVEGKAWHGGNLDSKKNRHYHADCVRNDYYMYNRKKVQIIDDKNVFFAQIPEIDGIDNLK